MGASTNRTGLSYVKEVTWGVNPTTQQTDINYTGEGLAFNIDNITSNSIRSDRQVTDLIQTGAECTGNIDVEIQYGGYDDLLLGALFAASWAGVGGTTVDTITSGATVGNLDFTIASAANTITFGSAVTHGIVVGQWFKLTGSTSDDGYHKATVVAGQVVTVAALTGDEVLDETDLATIKGSMARNGSTTNSFWIERTHDDVAQFFQFAGMVVNTFSIDFSANSVLTASFNFMGKSATLTQATSGTGTNVAAASTDYMNAVANVGNINIDGIPVASCLLQQMTMELNNNVRGIASIGQLGFCDVVEGEIGVTGNMNLYFNDETYYDLYLAATAFSFDARVTDGAGNTYIFTLPKCKFQTDAVNSGGKNADVMENTSYQAIMHGTLLYTVQIDKIPA
jgi:hypothetical protein